MTFHELDTVVIVRDLPAHGVRAGDLGAIVHVHRDGLYEVEVGRADGTSQAVITLGGDDLRPVSGADVLAVRPLSR
jgi:hypothetical protein